MCFLVARFGIALIAWKADCRGAKSVDNRLSRNSRRSHVRPAMMLSYRRSCAVTAAASAIRSRVENAGSWYRRKISSRSEERRVGQECEGTGRYRWETNHKKK